MSRCDGLSVFALAGSRDFGERVSRHLAIPLAAHEEREFEDGEHKSRALVELRGHRTFVIHSLHGDAERSANDKLCRLLFFIGALKEAGAEHVTAIVPYLCYARKDVQTQPNDPVTTKYVARLFEAVGTDCVVTIDVHNLAAFQNAFRCGTRHLGARSLFADHFVPLLRGTEIAIVSPDIGGAKRAEAFRRDLAQRLDREPTSAFIDKRRSGGIVSGDTLVGEVDGRTAIIIDDLISTGTTLRRAAKACREAGASRVLAAATHGLFIGKGAEIVDDALFDGIVVTDTVPPFRLAAAATSPKLTILDAARLVAESIRDDSDGRLPQCAG